MANNKHIVKLDKKLIEKEIIDRKYKDDYIKVHKLLNSHIKKTGKNLGDETFEKGEKELRKWLNSLSRKGAAQERLTSYLRCGLAHLCFDFVDSSSDTDKIDELVTGALKSFTRRKYNKTYFKTTGEKTTKVKKSTKKKSAKKSSAKKTEKNSKPSKKVKSVKKTAPSNKKKTEPKKVSKKRKPKNQKSDALIFKIIDFFK